MNIQHKASNSSQVRVFFALWPTLVQRRQLQKLAANYQRLCGGRVMRAETLHLTLLFLGTVERRRLEQLKLVVDGVAFSPFTFTLQQFGCWRHNRIGYAALHEEVEALSCLAQALRRAAGLSFDQRAFAPHVTLLRDMERMMEVQLFTQVVWPVTEFVLVESATTERGIRYQPLWTWPMHG